MLKGDQVELDKEGPGKTMRLLAKPASLLRGELLAAAHPRVLHGAVADASFSKSESSLDTFEDIGCTEGF